MNRAILFLVFAGSTLLGAGCHGTCEASDVALFWHFPNAGGTAELSCDQAGVVDVVITIDGSASDPMPCTQPDVNGNPAQGLTLTNFARGGTYQFQIDGLDATGTAIYTSAFDYTPPACGLNILDETLTSLSGDLAIAYSFKPAAGCAAPTSASPYDTTFIWYELLDQNGQVYDVVDGAHDPTAFPCGSNNGTIVVPNALYGQYTLNGIEEVEVLADGTSSVYHYNCVPDAFQHAAPGDVFDVVMVPPATGGAPTCF